MAAEVRGRWKRVRLGEVTRESGARNEGRIPDDEVHGVLKSDGLVPMRERVKGRGLTDRYKVVPPGAFAYNPMRLNIGSIAHSDLTRPVLVSPDYVVFECATDLLDHAYLNQVRRSREWEGFVGSGGSGSVRTRIYFRDLAEFTLPLPPLPEQRRIAEILTSVDEAIQATEAVIEQTKRVKQGLLARLLTRGIGHTRLRTTEIGKIPTEWGLVRLGDVLAAGPENGRSPAANESNSGVPTFSIAAVREGRVSIERHLKYAPVPPESVINFRLQRDDVLIVRGNANPDLVGTCGIVGSFPEGCIFPDILIRVRPAADLYVHFLVTVWNSPIVRKQILERAKSTNGTYKINQGDVASVRIPLPPRQEQEQLMAPLSDTDTSLRLLRAELDRLQTLKRGLLSDLLAGRVRVKVPRA